MRKASRSVARPSAPRPLANAFSILLARRGQAVALAPSVVGGVGVLTVPGGILPQRLLQSVMRVGLPLFVALLPLSIYTGYA